MTATLDKPPKVTVVCRACGAARETNNGRAPKGWKRGDDGRLTCGKCHGAATVTRCLVMPVSGPIGIEWEELRDVLRSAWAETTRCANWMLDALYSRDVRRRPGMEKIPAMAPQYLYPETAQFALPAQTRAQLEQIVTSYYRGERYKVLWTGESTLRSYRYGTPPFVCPAQGCGVDIDPDGVATVKMRIGEQRVTLKLRGGWKMVRQLKSLRKIASGEWKHGAIQIFRRRANPGDHREATDAKDAGGGQQPQWRVMVAIPYTMPRQVREGLSGSIEVRTDVASFLVAVDREGERVWTINGDRMRRWATVHQKFRERFRDDLKHERRTPPRKRKRITSEGTRGAEKYRHRVDSFLAESVAHLVGFVQRGKFAEVVYDDAAKSFLPEFPYFIFRERLKQKLEEIGVALRDASGGVTEKSRGPLAETASAKSE